MAVQMQASILVLRQSVETIDFFFCFHIYGALHKSLPSHLYFPFPEKCWIVLRHWIFILYFVALGFVSRSLFHSKCRFISNGLCVLSCFHNPFQGHNVVCGIRDQKSGIGDQNSGIREQRQNSVHQLPFWRALLKKISNPSIMILQGKQLQSRKFELATQP